MTKYSSIKQTSTTQTVAKKHLKTHLKRIRNREYCRLRDMVPAIANKQKVSKVMVIEEAVRYIDELHRALASRLINKDVTPLREGDKDEKIKELIHSFIPANFYERKPPMIDLEKQQRLPTYLLQTTVKKPSKLSNSDISPETSPKKNESQPRTGHSSHRQTVMRGSRGGGAGDCSLYIEKDRRIQLSDKQNG